MAFDTVVFALAMWKLVQIWKSGGKSRLVHILFRRSTGSCTLTAGSLLNRIYKSVPGKSARVQATKFSGSFSSW